MRARKGIIEFLLNIVNTSKRNAASWLYTIIHRHSTMLRSLMDQLMKVQASAETAPSAVEPSSSMGADPATDKMELPPVQETPAHPKSPPPPRSSSQGKVKPSSATVFPLNSKHSGRKPSISYAPQPRTAHYSDIPTSFNMSRRRSSDAILQSWNPRDYERSSIYTTNDDTPPRMERSHTPSGSVYSRNSSGTELNDMVMEAVAMGRMNAAFEMHAPLLKHAFAKETDSGGVARVPMRNSSKRDAEIQSNGHSSTENNSVHDSSDAKKSIITRLDKLIEELSASDNTGVGDQGALESSNTTTQDDDEYSDSIAEILLEYYQDSESDSLNNFRIIEVVDRSGNRTSMLNRESSSTSQATQPSHRVSISVNSTRMNDQPSKSPQRIVSMLKYRFISAIGYNESSSEQTPAQAISTTAKKTPTVGIITSSIANASKAANMLWASPVSVHSPAGETELSFKHGLVGHSERPERTSSLKTVIR
ncbi:hypothetical protein BJ741DRAFT_701790 [Chytriomyces cf. hyalinus JEL632]|nr:hypothetical protein BJ741DRAFT_701790 [Chytriomyces cf. hyalinus JEL632]